VLAPYCHCDNAVLVTNPPIQADNGWEEAIELAARIAEAHGRTIGEYCWNHENRSDCESTCWDEIAKNIRSLKDGYASKRLT